MYLYPIYVYNTKLTKHENEMVCLCMQSQHNDYYLCYCLLHKHCLSYCHCKMYTIIPHAYMVIPLQILECITVNLTLVYALLAYSSIHQKDFNTLLVHKTICIAV